MPYGPNSGTVPFTGYSPTLGSSDAVTPVTSGSVSFNGMTQEDRRISRALRQPPNRVARELLLTLLGATTGSAALETRARVTAQSTLNDLLVIGGVVPIETQTLINRNTTSADLSNITSMVTRTVAPASYPADVSGNGGGGRAGY